MVLFDKEGSIKRYSSPEEILTEFFDLRLEYYVKRREWLIEVLFWNAVPPVVSMPDQPRQRTYAD